MTFWLPRLAEKLGTDTRGLTPGALARLRQHQWPGNIRELRNVLAQALCLAAGPLIDEHDIVIALASGLDAMEGAASKAGSPDEKERVLAALDRHHWHFERTARSLGMDRSTLWRRMKKLGISRDDESS